MIFNRLEKIGKDNNKSIYLIMWLLLSLGLNNMLFAKITLVCGPSGAGKSSIISGVRGQNPEYLQLISHTTRSKRPNEVNGEDYYFINKAEFDKKKKEGYFLQFAEVYNNYYGQGKKEFLKALESSNMFLKDLKSEEIARIKEQFKEQFLTICINAPSISELKARLEARDGKGTETIQVRLQQAEQEMANCAKLCNLSFVNNDINETTAQVSAAVNNYNEKSIIKEISSISEALKFVDNNSIVFIDLDNTVMIPRQSLGSDQWFYYAKKHYRNIGYNDQKAEDQALDLWENIQDKTMVMPVENITAKVIKELQKRSMHVIALTSRSRLLTKTHEQLKSIGIDFNINNQKFGFLQLNDTGSAIIKDGVIMTGGLEDKGLVMQWFFNKANISTDQISKIIFLDDKKANVISMAKAAEKLFTKYVGLRYSGGDLLVTNFSPQVAHKQLIVFNKCNKLISDKIAYNMKKFTSCKQFP